MLGTNRFAPMFLLSIALASPLATRGEEVRIGGEFQVNTYTPGLQRPYSAAVEADGDFIIVWVSTGGQDGDANGVFGRRFASGGVALAQEFQLSLFTLGSETEPSVAVHDSGFVVVWESTTQDGGTSGVFARRFTSGGDGIGGEFRVNAYTPGGQSDPIVAAEANGDFVVIWSSQDQDGDQNGVFARRFSSAGTALGLEFQVPLHTVGFQNHHAIASDTDGDFIIVWDSGDGDAFGVFARRFSSAGGVVGRSVPGQHLHGWDSRRSPRSRSQRPTATSSSACRSQRAGSARTSAFSSQSLHQQRAFAVTGEMQVNTLHDRQSASSRPCPPTPNGDFMVGMAEARVQATATSYRHVPAASFSSEGQPLTDEFQVNSLHQWAPRVSQRWQFAPTADFVVAWRSQAAQDGSSYGAFAQRFAGPIALDVDGNGAADALTDGLLSLRYLFGFRGPTLVNGAVDLVGCSRCDAVAIEGYLSGLTS